MGLVESKLPARLCNLRRRELEPSPFGRGQGEGIERIRFSSSATAPLLITFS